MKLELEAVEIRHLAWLKNLRNEPEVMDFCRQPKLLTMQNQEEWYKRISREGDFIPFIVVDTDLPKEKQWVGYCALSKVDTIADKAECSYVMAPEYRGQGYGEQAIFQLLYFGFYNMGLQKIYTDVFEYNPQEVELNKMMGFTVDGFLPRHYFKRGKFMGAICMSILRENFDKKWADMIARVKHAESKPL